MIYLKDLKENKRFMDIGPTMAKFDYYFLLKSKKKIIFSIFENYQKLI